MRSARNAFAMRNGAMDGRLLSTANLRDLASLPSREILAGQVAGALQAPVTQLSGLLSRLLANGPGRLLNDRLHTFAGLMEARAKQMEGA